MEINEVNKVLAEVFDEELEHFGKTSIRMTQSQAEKRTRLMTQKGELIERAADLITDKFNKVSKIAYLDQPVLTAIVSEKVDENGHIVDGSVKFVCTLKAVTSRKKTRAELEFPIRRGKLRDTVIAKNMMGKEFFINEAGIRALLGLRDSGQHFRNFRNRARFTQFSAHFDA